MTGFQFIVLAFKMVRVLLGFLVTHIELMSGLVMGADREVFIFSSFFYQEFPFLLQKYNIRIKDHGQPMLISKSNAKDRRAGMPDLVYLVPEFCVMTGLTDEMR